MKGGRYEQPLAAFARAPGELQERARPAIQLNPELFPPDHLGARPLEELAAPPEPAGCWACPSSSGHPRERGVPDVELPVRCTTAFCPLRVKMSRSADHTLRGLIASGFGVREYSSV